MRSRLVRTWKESKPARGTHFLERSEVKTGQDIERKKERKPARGTYYLERSEVKTGQNMERK